MIGIIRTITFITVLGISAVCPLVGGILFVLGAAVGLIDIDM